MDESIVICKELLIQSLIVAFSLCALVGFYYYTKERIRKRKNW